MAKRNCAIVNCTNNGRKLLKWNEQFCDLHLCNKGTSRCICEPPFKLFPFPTKNESHRKIWIKAVNRKNENNRNWEPNSDSRLCSVHFVDGFPSEMHPYPTLCLGYKQSQCPSTRLPPRDRTETINISSSKCSTKPSKGEISVTYCNEPEITGNEKIYEDTNIAISTLQAANNDHSYSCFGAPDSSNTCICISCTEKDKEISILKEQVSQLQCELKNTKNSLTEKIKRPFNSEVVLKNDKKCKFYTGIPTVKIFHDVFQYLEPKTKKIRYWKSSINCNPLKHKQTYAKKHKRILSVRQEFILTLMKLRLGLLSEDLADRFGISTATVSSIFTTWIRFLSDTIGKLVYNPSKEAVRENLPPSFQNEKYSGVRHIIDCSEIFIEKPNNLQLQSLTWSDYKSHQTAKFLVSINPSGMINFISPVWGGRSSDKYITLNSGFLDIVEPYDTVMADRGFQIREELALRNAFLMVPPGRRGVAQFSKSDVVLTKDLANRRIYVEQAIRRMKSFRLLKFEMPVTLVQHLDDILKTISALCNIYCPLPRYN